MDLKQVNKYNFLLKYPQLSNLSVFQDMGFGFQDIDFQKKLIGRKIARKALMKDL